MASTSKKILLATHNAHKAEEIRAALHQPAWELITLRDRHLNKNRAEETGFSFIENALIKARFYSKISDMPCIADDSGLVIPALNGNPGIYSSRYAGENATDEENIKKLLLDIQNQHLKSPSAWFYCVLVYLENATDPCPKIFEGKWEGHILDAPRGKNGFGYDPIFFVTEKNCSAAELSMDQKNSLSHRGKAIKKMAETLASPLK